MYDFVLELAGVPILVEALHETTRDFCADYLTDAEPRERIVLTQDDIDAERRRSAEHDERDGVPVRDYSDAYLETLALYRRAADVLLAYDVVVFHGVVMGLEGKAYIITAPSGTGKSTHASYWLKQVPGAYVLNGDKPLLAVRDDEVIAYGTPWRGKERIGVPGSLPLAGLCIIERADEHQIERIEPREALPVLIQQTHRPSTPEGLVKGVEIAGRIGALVPLWRLGATLNEQSALVSSQAMAAEAGDVS